MGHYDEHYAAECARHHAASKQAFESHLKSAEGSELQGAIDSIRKGNPSLSQDDVVKLAANLSDKVVKAGGASRDVDFYEKARHGLEVLTALQPLAAALSRGEESHLGRAAQSKAGGSAKGR